MATYSPVYSPNDRAYYVIFSTLEIVPVKVIRFYIDSPNSSEAISYYIQRVVPDSFGNYIYLDFVEESKLLDFTEAKASLLGWLDAQRTRINNLTEPIL